MTRWNDKVLVPALFMIAVITACMSLPEATVAPISSDVSTALESVPTSAAPVLAPAEVQQDKPVVSAKPDLPAPGPEANAATEGAAQVDQLCTQIGNKLGSVSVEDCMQQSFRFGGGFSINNRPLVIKELSPLSQADDHFRVLLLGGIHGDEYSSISIIFKWMNLFSHKAQ